jgi:hypothetical protein
MSSIAHTDIHTQAAALRAELDLDDLVPISVFAAAVKKSPRTIERAIARKELRTVWIGNTEHVSISDARQGYLGRRTA